MGARCSLLVWPAVWILQSAEKPVGHVDGDADADPGRQASDEFWEKVVLFARLSHESQPSDAKHQAEDEWHGLAARLKAAHPHEHASGALAWLYLFGLPPAVPRDVHLAVKLAREGVASAGCGRCYALLGLLLSVGYPPLVNVVHVATADDDASHQPTLIFLGSPSLASTGGASASSSAQLPRDVGPLDPAGAAYVLAARSGDALGVLATAHLSRRGLINAASLRAPGPNQASAVLSRRPRLDAVAEAGACDPLLTSLLGELASRAIDADGEDGKSWDSSFRPLGEAAVADDAAWLQVVVADPASSSADELVRAAAKLEDMESRGLGGKGNASELRALAASRGHTGAALRLAIERLQLGETEAARPLLQTVVSSPHAEEADVEMARYYLQRYASEAPEPDAAWAHLRRAADMGREDAELLVAHQLAASEGSDDGSEAIRRYRRLVVGRGAGEDGESATGATPGSSNLGELSELQAFAAYNLGVLLMQNRSSPAAANATEASANVTDEAGLQPTASACADGTSPPCLTSPSTPPAWRADETRSTSTSSPPLSSAPGRPDLPPTGASSPTSLSSAGSPSAPASSPHSSSQSSASHDDPRSFPSPPSGSPTLSQPPPSSSTGFSGSGVSSPLTSPAAAAAANQTNQSDISSVRIEDAPQPDGVETAVASATADPEELPGIAAGSVGEAEQRCSADAQMAFENVVLSRHPLVGACLALARRAWRLGDVTGALLLSALLSDLGHPLGHVDAAFLWEAWARQRPAHLRARRSQEKSRMDKQSVCNLTGWWTTSSPALAAQNVSRVFGTAVPGGGFEMFNASLEAGGRALHGLDATAELVLPRPSRSDFRHLHSFLWHTVYDAVPGGAPIPVALQPPGAVPHLVEYHHQRGKLTLDESCASARVEGMWVNWTFHRLGQSATQVSDTDAESSVSLAGGCDSARSSEACGAHMEGSDDQQFLHCWVRPEWYVAALEANVAASPKPAPPPPLNDWSSLAELTTSSDCPCRGAFPCRRGDGACVAVVLPQGDACDRTAVACPEVDPSLEPEGKPGFAAEPEVCAFFYHRRAASAGNLASMHVLSHAFTNGVRGTPRDAAEAFKWSRRAMEAGDFRGRFDVAYSLEFGLGVPADPAAAHAMYHELLKSSGADVPIAARTSSFLALLSASGRYIAGRLLTRAANFFDSSGIRAGDVGSKDDAPPWSSHPMAPKSEL